MRVEKLLKRLRREFIKVNLIQSALDSIIFFLSINLFLFLFGFQLIEGYKNVQVLLFFTVIFLISDLFYRTKKYRLEIYEEKNPELRERLRTARDNLDQQNIVSQALFDDVLERARSVTSESIIPSKIIIQKILAVGVISFITVISGITSFQIQEDSGNIVPELDGIEKIIEDKKEQEGFKLHNSTKIYGEKKEVDSSEMQIDFNITGQGEDGKSEIDSKARNPEEVLLEVSKSSINENLKLAKKYSLAIKELETNS